MESAISSGSIADGETFLLQGIAEIKSIDDTRSRLAVINCNVARENTSQERGQRILGHADRIAAHRGVRSA